MDSQLPDPSEVAVSIRQSIDPTEASRLIRQSELRNLFGFRRWSANRREMVTSRLAVQGIQINPPLDMVRRNGKVELLLVPVDDRANAEMAAAPNIFMALTLGPLVIAFCTELGKRLGGTTADWLKRIKCRRKPGRVHAADILVEINGLTTTLEITETLTDEAKMALIDLDVNDPAIRGQTLRWDVTARAWRSIGRTLPQGVKIWWDDYEEKWMLLDELMPSSYSGPILLWNDPKRSWTVLDRVLTLGESRILWWNYAMGSWVSGHTLPSDGYRGPVALWNDERGTWGSLHALPEPTIENSDEPDS